MAFCLENYKVEEAAGPLGLGNGDGGGDFGDFHGEHTRWAGCPSVDAGRGRGSQCAWSPVEVQQQPDRALGNAASWTRLKVKLSLRIRRECLQE